MTSGAQTPRSSSQKRRRSSCSPDLINTTQSTVFVLLQSTIALQKASGVFFGQCIYLNTRMQLRGLICPHNVQSTTTIWLCRS